MKTILCFGDSNTWCCRPDNHQRHALEDRWPRLLQKKLGDGYVVIDEGHPGRTTVWTDPIEGKMSGIDYLTPCLESHAPFDLLLIMLGTNDCKERYNVNAGTIAFGTGRLIQQARFIAAAQGCAPEILVVSPPAISEAYKRHPLMGPLFGREADEKARALPAALKQIADQNNCHFFDGAAVAQVSEIDGIHMDAQGCARLSDALCDVVKNILKAE